MLKRANLQQSGFSLVEILIAMSLLSMMALFLARLLMAGIQLNHISNDETQMNTIASDRIEQLKNMSFKQLGVPCINSSTSCGNLNSNYTDTSVTPNVKYYDDSVSGYTVRWIVSAASVGSSTRKTTVRVLSNKLKGMGNQREMVLYFERMKF